MSGVVCEAMVRQILGRVHVGQSNRAAIRYFVSRLRNGHRTWRTLSRSDRREWMQAVLRQHAANRAEYRSVMGGSR